MVGRAGTFPALSSVFEEFPQIVAMNECRSTVVYGREAVFNPVSDGIAMRATMACRLFNRIGPVDFDMPRIWTTAYHGH